MQWLSWDCTQMWIWCTKLCCTYSWFRYLDDWMTSSFTRYFTMCYQPPKPAISTHPTAGVSNLLNPKGSQNPKGGVTPSSWRSCNLYRFRRLKMHDPTTSTGAGCCLWTVCVTGTLYREKLITNTCVIILIMFMTQMSTKWMAAIGILSHISSHRCILCHACSFLFDIKHNCNLASCW